MAALAGEAIAALPDDAPVRTTARAVFAASATGGLPPEQALDRLPAARDAALADDDVETATMCSLALWRTARALGRPDARAHAARTAELAARGGPLLRAAMLTMYVVLGDRPDQVVAWADELLGTDVVALPSTANHLGRDAAMALRSVGRHAEAAGRARRVQPGLRAVGDRACTAFLDEVLALAAADAGDLSTALELCDRAVDGLAGTPLWPVWSPVLQVSAAAVHVQRGELDEASARLSRLADEPPGQRGPLHAAALAAGRALLALGAGDDDAVGSALVAVEAAAASGWPSTGTPLALLGCAWAASGREPARAARLLGAAEAVTAAEGTFLPLPAVRTAADRARERLRAQLGDAALEEHLAEGRTWSASTALAQARRGRGPRRRPATGWDALTPAERSVVELVAAGRTNAEVAAHLFLSVRTVTTHLTHVYAKLGLSSRSQLAAAAAARSQRTSSPR